VVSPAFLRKMLAEHQSGRRDNSGWLWWLLMLDYVEEYPSRHEIPMRLAREICQSGGDGFMGFIGGGVRLPFLKKYYPAGQGVPMPRRRYLAGKRGLES